MIRLPILAACLAALLLALPAAAQEEPAVEVETRRPTHKTVARADAAPDDELYDVDWFYNCDPLISGTIVFTRPTEQGGVVALVRVTRVEATLDLRTTLTHPANSPAETPRLLGAILRMAERLHADGNGIAEQIGESMIGRGFAGEGPTRADAAQAALTNALHAYTSLYFLATRDASVEGRDRMQAIADHVGLDDVDWAQLVEQGVEAAQASDAMKIAREMTDGATAAADAADR